MLTQRNKETHVDEPGERETRVLLLRHAESAAPERFHGAESDIGLSERGRERVEPLARYLAALRPQAVWSSNMRRALDTARPIALACGLPLQVAPDLHERKMGALSGMLKTEGWHRYAEEKDRWKAGDLEFAYEGAESFVELRERSLRALEEVVPRELGGTVVIVSHGVVIRVLLSALIKELEPAHFDEIGIDNLALNDLRFGGVLWRAVALNWHPGEVS